MLGLGATVLGVTRSREDLERLREVNPSAGDRLHVFSADLTDASQRRLVMGTGKNRGLRRLRIACFVHSWVPTRQRGAPVLVQNAGPYLQ